jgi:nitrogen fixation NifU-like protein
MYSALLMDHFKNPRFPGCIPNAHFSITRANTSCGDVITISGCVEKGVLYDVRHYGKGCIISQATASIVCQFSFEKKRENLKELSQDDVGALIGMELGPNRLQCALISLHALQDGLQQCLIEVK